MAVAVQLKSKRCAHCGAALAGNELAGNCPRCLAAALLGAHAPGPAGTATRTAVRRLGDYELLEEVARGGMGVVFRARQVSLGREVALKVLRDAWLATPAQVRRFRAEAANAAKLKHPHIVSVHQFGNHDGQHYFTMDLVRGPNLAEVTSSGPLPPRQAAELLVTVAEAVQHAHEHGVLHRDLKPSNVLLDSHGEPQVTDFGLARPLDEESSLTLTGQVLGSPGYIAPEQAKARGAVGPAADVYGLGALLFHLLTGRAPFVGASAAETLARVLQEEPLSPRLLNPAVPTDLAAVCLKCLRRLPPERYHGAAKVAEDLRRFLQGQPTLAQPPGLLARTRLWGRRRPALAAAVTALLAVGILGVAGILWQWRRAERASLISRARGYVADMDLAGRAVNEDDLGTAKELLRRYWPRPRQTDLRNWEWRYLAKLSEGDPHVPLFAHSSAVLNVRFLDDKTLLTAGIADWRTVLWDLAENRPSKMITNRGPAGGVSEIMAVAPGRSAMFYRPAWNYAPSVTLVDLQRGTETELLVANGSVQSLDISPDQQVLAVAYGNRVGLWDLNRQTWAKSFESVSGSAIQGLFSPEGDTLVIADDVGHIAFWNLAEARLLGVITNTPGSLGRLSFSADGRWLVNPGLKSPIQIWSGKDRSLIREFHDSPSAERAVFSRDGRWLATIGGDPTLRLWDTSSWRLTRIFHGHTDPITAVAFSPNGNFLASGARNGEVKLWSLRNPPLAPERVSFAPSEFIQLAADGSGFARIERNGQSNGPPSWKAEVWTTTPLQRAFSVPLPRGLPSSGVVLPAGRGLVLGGADGTIRLSGPIVGQEVVLPRATRGESYIMDASLDGSTLAIKGLLGNSPDNLVRLFRLPGLELFAELQNFQNVHGLKLSDDGKLLAGFTGPGDIGVWRIPSMTGPPMWRGVAALERVSVSAFSPNHRWLAAATPDDGGAFIWDLATHRRTVLPRALTRYHSLSFSPDSSRLAAGSEGESKLFDTSSGQTVLSFKTPGLKLAFGRDGEKLLAVHTEGAAVFHAPAFEKLQFHWLKEQPSGEPPPYLGANTNYVRPDRP